MSEGRRVTEERMQQLHAMEFDTVLEMVEQTVETEVAGPSGGTYRVSTNVFWDMEPFESAL